jgi:hypothetical protein
VFKDDLFALTKQNGFVLPRYDYQAKISARAPPTHNCAVACASVKVTL